MQGQAFRAGAGPTAWHHPALGLRLLVLAVRLPDPAHRQAGVRACTAAAAAARASGPQPWLRSRSSLGLTTLSYLPDSSAGSSLRAPQPLTLGGDRARPRTPLAPVRLKSSGKGGARGGSGGRSLVATSAGLPRGAPTNEASITPAASQFWRKAMADVDRPGLSHLIGSLDWEHPLGVTKARAAGAVKCYDKYLSVKQQHPTALVLVRMGDFYEAIGFDALVLMQHCGCNPMSADTGIAAAGFPKQPAALRGKLNRLIEAGFSVAMVEEVGVRAGSRPGSGAIKERQLVALVTASSPYYLYGDVEDEYEGDDTPPPKPIVGVSIPSSGGFRLLRYCPAERGVLVMSQLGMEALLSQLHATGLAPPLHLHASVGVRDAAEGKAFRTARQLRALLGSPVEEYGGEGYSDVAGFKVVVVRLLGLSESELYAMRELSPPYPKDTPVPPSLSTVTQLGLGGARGVPSLLSALLPPSCPGPCREWVRLLLLLPPPATVAEDIRMAAAVLAEPGQAALPLPPLLTHLGGARIAALLAGGAAGQNTLREMKAMLERCSELLRLEGPRAELLLGALVGVLHWSLDAHAGVHWPQMPPPNLAADCEAVAAQLGAVLPELEPGPGLALAARLGLTGRAAAGAGPGAAGSADEVDEGEEGGGARSPAADGTCPPGGWLPRAQLSALLPCDPARLGPLQQDALLAAERLVRRLEGWRLMVREECVQEAATKVTAARGALLSALLELAGALEAGGVGAEMLLPARDNAVWVRLMDRARKLPAKEQRAAVERVAARCGLALKHPRNRKGAPEAERYTSDVAEEAAVRYVGAVEEAEKQARLRLRELCEQLSGASTASPPGPQDPSRPSRPSRPALPTLLAAHELSIIVTALERHVAQAKRAGWNWPLMPGVHTLSQPGGEAGRAVRLVLPGLWPYWMERRAAVANDVVLQPRRMALLTGPNMAGKSTVLRSIAAAALLSICGLSVPAERGSAPLLPPGEPAPSMQVIQQLAPAPALASPPAAGAGPEPAAGSPAPLALSASWLSHVSLRNFSGDSPLEGKSAFAVEMEDTAATLSVASRVGPGCLVLLDELGKGTEVVAGSALAGAVLDALLGAGAAGVFATHLHDLVWLARPHADAGRLEYWAMEVREEEEERRGGPGQAAVRCLRPTRRVLVGRACLLSLALQVAADCGMPPELLQAAAGYEAQLGDMMRAAREAAYGAAGGGGVMRGGAAAPAGAAVVGTGDAVLAPLLAQEAAEWAAGAGAWEPPQPPLQPAAQAAAAAPPREERAAPSRGDLFDELVSGRERQMQGSAGQGAAASEGREREAAEGTEQEQQLGSEGAVQLEAGGGGGGGSGSSVGNGGDECFSHTASSVGAEAAAAGAQAPMYGAAFTFPPRLTEAAGYLRDSMRAVLARAAGVAEAELGPELGALHWVRPEWSPPGGHAGEAVVYVLHCWDGRFYVGETEDIPRRIADHRKTETRERTKADQPLFKGTRRTTSLAAVYCVVPREASGGGKSGALDVESQLIGVLQRAGFPMRSTHDKKRNVRHRPQLPELPPLEAGSEKGAGGGPGAPSEDGAGAVEP